MSHSNSLRLALAILAGAVSFHSHASRAQSQTSQADPVAEAARRAREQKITAEKPEKVITNDTLEPLPPAQAASANAAAQSNSAAPAPSSASAAAQSSADSSSASAASDASATSSAPAPAASAGDADQNAKDAAELATLKQQLADAQKDVDLLLRELALDQDSVYSNPNYTAQPTGTSKLDDLKQQITGKQQDVDALKARLAALQSSVDGKASPAAPPPSTPPQL